METKAIWKTRHHIGVLTIAVAVLAADFLLKVPHVTAGTRKAEPKQEQKYDLLYSWVGVFTSNGIALRLLPMSFVIARLDGRPFDWETLHHAQGQLCPGDSKKVHVSLTYKIRRFGSEGELLSESTGTHNYALWQLEAQLIKEHLQPGIYSLTIKPEVRVLYPFGKCGGFVSPGPVRYKVTPLRHNPNLLVLGPLTKGNILTREEPRFTVTEDGPRLLQETDLETPFSLRPFLRLGLPFLVLCLTAGYFVLLGFYHGLGLPLHTLPPYAGSMPRFLAYTFRFLPSWRSLAYPALGILLFYILHVLALQLRAIILWGPEPVTLADGTQILSLIGIPVQFQLAVSACLFLLIWLLLYLCWAGRWLTPHQSIVFFIVFPFTLLAYSLLVAFQFPSDMKAESGLSIQGFTFLTYVGAALAALFCLYYRGIREVRLLIDHPERHLSLVNRTPPLPPVKLVVLANLGEHLIGWNPTIGSTTVIPTKDVEELIPLYPTEEKISLATIEQTVEADQGIAPDARKDVRE